MTETPTSSPSSGRALTALIAVLAVCAALRVWLMVNTVAIAPDGHLYIEMARQWPTDLGGVIRQYDYPVGYPIAVTIVHWLMQMFGLARSVWSWDTAAQIVSLVAGVGATAAVGRLAWMTFNPRVGWITALLFGLGYKWASLGADALSDALAICLQMWAVVLALVAVRWLGQGRKGALAAAGGVGLCAGVGYLVRPESLLVAGFAVALWLAYHARPGRHWRLALAAAGIALVIALACAAPYMAEIGGVTKKKAVSQFIAMGGSGWPFASVSVQPRIEYDSVERFVTQLFEAMHPVVMTLMLVQLLAYVVIWPLRMKRFKSSVPVPRADATWLDMIAVPVLILLAIRLHATAGYLEFRHVMLLAALLAPVAGAGCITLSRLVAWCLQRVTGAADLRPIAWVVCVTLLAGGLAWHSLRPLNYALSHFRQAARYVAAVAEPDDLLLTDSTLAAHYAGRPSAWIFARAAYAPSLRARIEQVKPQWVLLMDAEARQAASQLASEPNQPLLIEARHFPQPGTADFNTVSVYRVNPAALPE